MDTTMSSLDLAYVIKAPSTPLIDPAPVHHSQTPVSSSALHPYVTHVVQRAASRRTWDSENHTRPSFFHSEPSHYCTLHQ